MARDLDEVVRRSLDERVERLDGAAPAPGALAAVVAGARRRRRRRRVNEVVAGVAGVAAIVGAVALGGGHDRPAPAHTPSPTATGSASPSPSTAPTSTPASTPSPTEEQMPTPAMIDAGYGLPATVPAPAGIWGQVGAGWTLGIYRPVWSKDGSGLALRNTLVLASPTGTEYRVLELPLDEDVTLARWTPGATRALVTVAAGNGTGYVDAPARGWLDLRTGAITPAPAAVEAPDAQGHPPDFWLLGVDHRGDEVWVVDYLQRGGNSGATIVVERPDGTLVHRIPLGADEWSGLRLDPTGHRIVVPGHDEAGATFDLVDLDTGSTEARPYGVQQRYCQVVGWHTSSTLLARCRPGPWETNLGRVPVDGPGDPLYLVDLGGGAPRKVHTLVAGDPAVDSWGGVATADGRTVVGAESIGDPTFGRCRVGLYSLDGNGTATALPADHLFSATPVGTLGGRVYVLTDADCSGAVNGPVQLESLVGGTRTQLLRPPAADDPLLWFPLHSWVVAGGPVSHPWD